MALSPADSVDSPEAATPEVLSAKISQVRHLGEEYSAALEQYINKLCELDLERENIPARCRSILGKALLGRRREEEKKIEQVEALLVDIREMKDVENDDKGGDREKGVEEITKSKRRASGELIPARPTLVTYTETSNETSIDASLIGIEDNRTKLHQCLWSRR